MAQHLAVTALSSCLYVYKLVWSEASVTPVKKGPQKTWGFDPMVWSIGGD